MRSGNKLALAPMSFGLASVAAVSGALAQTEVASSDTGNGKGVETVVVTSKRSSLDVLPQKILDTPQSINVIPAQVIKE
jgi:outer membrane receptor for monomeric catechols